MDQPAHHNHHARPRRPANRAVAAPVWSHALTTQRRDRHAAVDPGLTSVDLAWHRRQLHSTAPGHYLLTVPVSGAPCSTATDIRLTRLLHNLWVTAPTRTQPRIDFVTATITSQDAAAQRLSVELLTDDLGDPRRIDDETMAHQLRHVLNQLMLDA